MVRTMERLTTKPLDVHLMVEKPLDFLPELEELGVKRVSVHYLSLIHIWSFLAS